MRFRLTTDILVVGDGWYIDDVSIDVFSNTGANNSPVGKTNAKSLLFPVKPNPSSGNTVFSYQLAAPGRMSLNIYDITGRLVRTLESGTREAGKQTVIWDGRDSYGRIVADGVYFYRLTASDYTATRKFTIIR